MIPGAEQAAYALADRLKQMIVKRTGISAEDLECPREKSAMTPCGARDGGMAVCFSHVGTAMCVGCEHKLEPLVKTEEGKYA